MEQNWLKEEKKEIDEKMVSMRKNKKGLMQILKQKGRH